MKPIAKSLHTITVIAQVAAMIRATNSASVDGAVEMALQILGLAGKPDVYGLAAKAAKSVR